MVATGLGLSKRASASVVRALSLSELVHTSRFACVGTAVNAVGRWETIGRSERIVTYSLIRLEHSVDGRPAPTRELMVRTLGGRVDGIGQVVPGEATLRLNEPATVFLEDLSKDLFAVTAMAQGHYPLVADAKGVKRLQPRTAQLELVGDVTGSAVKRLTGRTVPEVESLVYSEINQ
jgi:hypothetical protein